MCWRLAAAHGYTRLVLGAWGCGVFRNDPEVVAAAFVIICGASGRDDSSGSYSRCWTFSVAGDVRGVPAAVAKTAFQATLVERGVETNKHAAHLAMRA